MNDSSWSSISLKPALLFDLLCPVNVCGLEMGDRCAAFLQNKTGKGEGREYHMHCSVKGRTFI